jgi:phenylalanine-4-hydroxylase
MNVTGMRNLGGQLMLIQFTDCTVSYKNEILHSPENADFDLVIGSEIVSAFAGAADFLSFDLVNHVSETNTVKPSLSKAEDKLNTLYQNVRLQRENNEINEPELLEIFQRLKKEYPNDWLCALEIFELTRNNAVLDRLKKLQTTKTDIAHLIENGLELIK